MAKASFLRHAAIYGAGDILVYAASFLLLPLYVRALSQEEYGTLEALSKLGEMVLLCLLFKGLRQGMFSFHNQAKSDAERRSVIGSALFMTLLFLGGGGIIAALLAEPLSRCLKIDDPAAVRLAVLAVFLEAFATLLLALAQARVQSVFFVGVSVAQFLARVTLCILLVVVCHWGLTGVLIAWAGSGGGVAAFLLARELARGGLRLDRKQLSAMFWFALPFVPGGIGFFLLNSGDRLFLTNDKVQLGIYAMGYKVALVVKLFSRQPLYKVWSAQMYEAARRPDAAEVFGKVFTRILAVYVGVGLAVCLAAPEAVFVLGGERYFGAVNIIPPVVLAYYFQTATDLMESGFYIRRKTAWRLPVMLASAVVTMGLYALLIPQWQILGAAVATLLGFLFMAALTGVVAQRVFLVRYEWVRVVAVLAWAAGIWGVGSLLPAGLTMLALKAGLWLVWLGLVWVTVLSAEEKQWARDLLASCGFARLARPQAAQMQSERDHTCALDTRAESCGAAAGSRALQTAGHAGTGPRSTPSRF
jgi:O-antigen/teichoic acid export membrane protein